MPLWPIDYFEQKAIEKQQIEEKLFAFPLFASKQKYKFVKVSPLPFLQGRTEVSHWTLITFLGQRCYQRSLHNKSHLLLKLIHMYH